MTATPSIDSSTYRWNVAPNAAGFDAAAELIHPHYLEMQQYILNGLPFPRDSAFCLLDAGGGSGRLVEQFLRRFPHAQAIVLDQSDAFLEIAQNRLRSFTGRAVCVRGRLQHDWSSCLHQRPSAIVSMSAIHHLDSQEKKVFYQRCYENLAPGGMLLNGDEIRPPDDVEYLARCRQWVAHKRRIMDAGLVSAAVCELLERWEERNVMRFGDPRVSGDDCHETIRGQIQYLRDAGFPGADCPWSKDLWAILRGQKGK